MRACTLAIITLCLVATAYPVRAEIVTPDRWRVVDGDTILIPNHKIDLTGIDVFDSNERLWVLDNGTIIYRINRLRLAGIDAPEINQYCQNANGEGWRCGLKATERLIELVADEVTCELHDQARYKAYIATCVSNGLDVARVLVGEGLAVAEYAETYKADERQAKEAKRGIWAGEFLHPRDWRKQNQ